MIEMVFMFLLPAVLSDSQCSNSYFDYNPIFDKCIQNFLPEYGNFTQAELMCHYEGGHLLAVHSQQQNDELARLISNGGAFFIGLHYDRAAGIYSWTDGSQVDYNAIDADPPPNNCAQVNRGYDGELNGIWINIPCSQLTSYFCATPPKYSSTIRPIATTSHQPRNCPAGWLVSEARPNSCYYVYDAAMVDYFSALRFCKDLHDDAHMLVVHNAFENSELRDLITSETIWLGLDKGSGAWRWTDGEPIAFANWNNGQPMSDEQCAVLERTSGKWKVVDCTLRLPLICQLYL